MWSNIIKPVQALVTCIHLPKYTSSYKGSNDGFGENSTTELNMWIQCIKTDSNKIYGVFERRRRANLINHTVFISRCESSLERYPNILLCLHTHIYIYIA